MKVIKLVLSIGLAMTLVAQLLSQTPNQITQMINTMSWNQPLASPVLSWVPNTGGNCTASCSLNKMRAVTTQFHYKSTSAQPSVPTVYAVCSAAAPAIDDSCSGVKFQAGQEGERVGFNLPFSSTDNLSNLCTIAWCGEKMAKNFRCLCAP